MAQTVPSTYRRRGTQLGPDPVPAWVITTETAFDTDLGVIKTGKEAEVSLVERADGDTVSLMAVKRYRGVTHRGFRNDAVYRAGRQMRDTRAQRAADAGTTKGDTFRTDQWAANEFDVMAALWSKGAAVPYPVQRVGTELMIEYLGDEDEAAPRLMAVDLDADLASSLFAQFLELLRAIVEVGIVHGDLSPYNLLVWEDRLWAIDFPQAVDLHLNSEAPALLRRDVENVCKFFASKGVAAADPEAVMAGLPPIATRRPHPA
ncbi:MAG TPA: RIO1 family regulatory kinase/ATPase [Acidimicrobiales bacterium]|nr:RIO1 family regulatory kinase/ATPase [Acidimicrobiales bacterium]